MEKNNKGMGVMIGMLGGNAETVNAIKTSLGKTIEMVELKGDSLYFKFTDASTLTMFDDGQSCCESRYMKTDDDLTEYAESTLLDFELKSIEYNEEDYETHEIQFLDVKTSKGIFQMSNHNEHNGYYGGFWLVAKTTIK